MIRKLKRVLFILAQVLLASISLYVLVISVGITEIKSVVLQVPKETFNHRNVTARQRVIYSWDKDKVRIYQYSHSTFTGCEYTNCLLNYSSNPEDTKYADVVLVDFRSFQNIAQLSRLIKQNTAQDTVWLLDGHESPRYHWFKWRDFFNDFDGAITYTRDAAVYKPYGQLVQLNSSEVQIKSIYNTRKTKGAFAYVSNCFSGGYNRLKLMRQLGEYIDVDIYGGCTGRRPCALGDWGCEARLHAQYHFYLSWENSLCKDYITEKFWKVLSTDGYYIPVALGGLTLEEYTSVAPPNSFLHLYNFSSVAELGSYMKTLMANREAFDQYNAWRSSFKIQMYSEIKSCKLCEIANNPSKFKRKHSNMAKKFNSPMNCREIPQYQSFWYSLLNVLL